MSETRKAPGTDAGLIARVRAAARQEQFLDVVSAEEARARFERHLDLTPLGLVPPPTVQLLQALYARGLEVDQGALTIEEAVAELTRLLSPRPAP